MYEKNSKLIDDALEKSKLKPKKKKVKSEDEKEDKPLGVRKTKKRKTVYR